VRTKSVNPFLPKPKFSGAVRWRKGPFVKPAEDAQEALAPRRPFDLGPLHVIENELKGKLPSKPQLASRTVGEQRASVYTELGKLSNRRGFFFVESFSSWGSLLDMIPLAHGPVGCSNYAWSERLNLPGFEQGIESFTALNACTNLESADLQDAGDERLAKAIDEAGRLFPLASGMTILNEDPIAVMRSNVKRIAASKTLAHEKLIVSLSSESIRTSEYRVLEKAAGIKTARALKKNLPPSKYDVAISFQRTAPGLVWIVSKLLSDIGLNPVHQQTCSSASDLARLADCKLIIGLADSLDPPSGYAMGGNARLLEEWFGIPLLWTCFLNPAMTDASLRAIAAQFGPDIEEKAERVIAKERKKIDFAINKYRLHLEDKLLLDLTSMCEQRLEPYRMLGMRIGSTKGWPGKRGVHRMPRLVFDRLHPSDKAIDSYIAEAKPDLVLYFRRSEAEWRKRGQAVLAFNHFFNHDSDAYWGYDGFLLLAAALERAVSAPWKKLVKPPWPSDKL